MERLYNVKQAKGKVTIETNLKGYDLLYQPTLNKGSAFTTEERDTFRLHGILPPHVSSLEEQCKRSLESVQKKRSSLEKYMNLISLQHRNETLFYKLLQENLEEFMPIIYTPTVGQACEEFSHIFRRTKGLWITPDDKGQIQNRLENAPCQDVRLIVITDNESILGIGDQGAGGIAISIGKLSLYCIAAGIHPSQLLPISLDVGTNNNKLLRDPLYIGYRKPRLTGKPYDELVDEFIAAVQSLYPKALIQWEDFRKQNAYSILDRHRETSLSFNDDIQGTASVALSGILTGCDISQTKFEDQRILIMGAGAAGVGIARLIHKTIGYLYPDKNPLFQIAITDSTGLLTEDQPQEPYKEMFVWDKKMLDFYHIQDPTNLLQIIENYKPTVLIGASGQGGLFSKELVQAMCKYQARPIIMPFSNPNNLSEATPSDLMEWTGGNALVATGSPFPTFVYEGKVFTISQGNNVFVFPGIGLGALVGEAKTISSKMFYIASKALSQAVTDEEKAQGMLFPHIKRLREVTKAIARDVISELHPSMKREEIDQKLNDFMWDPQYPTLVQK